uniref:Uncharacterized protein n=1 Tax=Tanacetum cinerariifolium TaxID=118510 RepID=A0A6L2JDN1_TANCI|nr:hypothetical protein [Tanacetum cinerariifolium]
MSSMACSYFNMQPAFQSKECPSPKGWTDPNAQAEGRTRSDTGAQVEGQAGSNPDETSKGQAGSNPDETSEGQARPDPGNAEARVQSTLSPVVHAGSDREHMNIDVANLSAQPSTEQLYEGFTVTVYPNVQENLKLAVEEPVLLEEPASSSGTLSSLQHLSRDFTFGDQFFSDKPSDADISAETEVESMVNVPIQQALSSISLMTLPTIDLTSRPESPKEHQQLKATTTDTTTTTTTLPPPQAPQQSTTEAMMVKRIGELEHTLADLIQVNKTMEERLDKHEARLYTLEQLDIPQQADMKEILHQRMWETDSYKSHEDHMQLFEALEKSINRDQSEELAHDLAEAWKKRKKGRESPKTPPGSPSHQPPPPPPPAGPSGTPSIGLVAPSPAKTAATTKHQAWSTPDITLKPLVSLTLEDLDIDEAMGPDEQAQLSDEENIRNSLLAQTDDITTFMVWFCKRRGITELKPQDLEGPAYEIVKVFHLDMKVAYYPDAGLEQMVPDQFWIEEECKYDIAAMYGISYWWFQRQRFYIDRHTSEGDRSTRVEDFQLGIESYQSQVNLTKPQWTATGFEYKHDYTVIESPRAVIFQDKYGDQQVESRFKYEVLDQEGCRSVQRVHVRDSEAFEDKEDLSQPGELCWQTRQRGRLQNFEAYRLIKLFRCSRSLSDDL